MTEVTNKINELITRVDKYKIEPDFSNEVKARNNRTVPETLSNNEIIKIFIELIAFSQNANSKKVAETIKKPIFKKAFADYDIDKIAKMNPCDIADEYWKDISGIRQQAKIFHIVTLARKINKIGSFDKLLLDTKIPKSITTNADIEEFWSGFKKLKKVMNDHKVPFFRSTTSLLHFLLEMGYDCAKPDLVVMRVAGDLGIVESEKGEKNLVKAIRTIQEYSIDSEIRPSVIDFYFLIDGGQKEATKFVKDEFYKKEKQ